MGPVLFNVSVVLYNKSFSDWSLEKPVNFVPGILISPSALSEETLSFSGNKLTVSLETDHEVFIVYNQW